MKYEIGGVTGTLGTALTVEVPLKGKPRPKDPNKPDGTKPANGRIRFSAWTRSYELFYKNPAQGGVPDFDRARTFLDTVAGKLDDLVLLQTINIQVPKPNPDSTPTGKIVWDSDFIYSDDDAPKIAQKLVDECHQRGIALHAGYAVVDAGNTPGRRAIALRKFLETASDSQLKDHATQAVQFIKSAGFDGLSFDIEVNHLSVDKHAEPIKKLFTELASQMAGDGLILSYAGYPFLTDGNAPSFPPANPLPYSLCKIGKNVMARPQAYMNHGETKDQWKSRLDKTIKCALEDVGLAPEQLQLGIDFTGDQTFDAVRGDDMNDVVAQLKAKKVGTCIWRLEPGPAPKSDDLTKWDKTLNDGVPPAKPTGKASGSPPPTTNSNTAPAGPQPEPDDMPFGVDYGSVDGNTPDFDKAKEKAKLAFAIVRSNYGTWADPHWKRDWQVLADKGIVRGAYLFLRFPYKGKSAEDPAKQAQAMINTIGDLAKTDFPPCIDVEYPGDGRKDTGLTAVQCLEGVRKAWRVLKDHYGVAPMIYTSARVWRDDLNNLSAPDLVESPLWLTPYICKAHLAPVLDKDVFKGGKKDPKVPPPWGDGANWWIHQFQGDSTGFPGFKQVDVSRFNVLQKGASGERVKWVQRRLKLDQSGQFDDAMVDALKKHQSANGLDQSGVVDLKTFATLCWVPVDGSAVTNAPTPAPAPDPAPKKDDPPAPAPKKTDAKPAETESADWRPYVGKDSVPDNVIETIRKNRQKYPKKTLKDATGKWAGKNHFDYSPGGEHRKWAQQWVQAKIDAAQGGMKHAPTAFMEMLDKEGLPASWQSYDNQIVTWGVGQGGKGNGVHAFENLNKDPKMKKLLEDLGINFTDGDYYVVDTDQKKVIKSDPGEKGNDNRHITPLDAWRRQPDLISAIIGLSEDEGTRDAVAEAQYQVYLKDSAAWPGQDKVFTRALYFMIIHLTAWYPAFAKHGFNVETEFAAIGGGTPSLETDAKLAPRLANKFVRYGKTYFKNQPKSYADLVDRTKSHMWASMRADGKKEGFDPGELVYDADLT